MGNRGCVLALLKHMGCPSVSLSLSVCVSHTLTQAHTQPIRAAG